MEVIRSFVRESPRSAGVLLAGRAHFFDSTNEMFSALGLGNATSVLNLSEFNEKQVEQFLKNQGWAQAIPDWIPSRPLLLGYLVSRNLLQETLAVDAAVGPASGWNSLLDRIAQRESEIEAGIDADTVRRLIEYVASLARASADGLGPLAPDQMTEAFATVCGYPPDDRGAVLLQRLPGLGGHSSEDGARIFIDSDLAEAARGVRCSILSNAHSMRHSRQTLSRTLYWILAPKSLAFAPAGRFSMDKFVAAIDTAQKRFRTDTLKADILLALRSLGFCYEGHPLYVREVILAGANARRGRGFVWPG